MIEIERRPLRALEEDAAPPGKVPGHLPSRIRPEGEEALPELEAAAEIAGQLAGPGAIHRPEAAARPLHPPGQRAAKRSGSPASTTRIPRRPTFSS